MLLTYSIFKKVLPFICNFFRTPKQRLSIPLNITMHQCMWNCLIL